MRPDRTWRVFTRADDPWTPETWMHVADAACAESPVHASKHAATYRWSSEGREIYVKNYHAYSRLTMLKDCLRPSKASHVQRISDRLAAQGFVVPEVVAVAEQRWGPIVRRSWVATTALAGTPVAVDLALTDRHLHAKHATLRAIGTAVARLHEARFTAGDLVPSNIWIDEGRVAFLDHDRTTAGYWASSWWRTRRNLVQLNRHVLPGVTATDRLRVYRAYTSARGWESSRARRRLGWVVRKTIQRRQRFDGVSPDYTARVSFRELMRAPTKGPVT